MILAVVVHSTARIMSTFMSLSAVQNMIHFMYFNSSHVHHRVYYELTMACFPVGLISSNGLSVASSRHKGKEDSIPSNA